MLLQLLACDESERVAAPVVTGTMSIVEQEGRPAARRPQAYERGPAPHADQREEAASLP